RAFRLGADVVRRTSTVGLAEGMSAGNQGHGLFVVHRHAGEGFADIARGSERIRVAVRALRVHVDETHLHGGERIGEIAIAAVTLVGHPLAFRPPVDVLARLPYVFTSAGEAEGLETHRFEG